MAVLFKTRISTPRTLREVPTPTEAMMKMMPAGLCVALLAAAPGSLLAQGLTPPDSQNASQTQSQSGGQPQGQRQAQRPTQGQGQPPSPTLPAQKEAMQKVAFLVGQWKGTGWMMMGPDRRDEFVSTETVESRLDGLVLIIEGVHESSDPAHKGLVVHHALAEVSWDAKQSAYRFRSHLATGDESDFAGKIVDGAFVWGFETPRGRMRYTIKLDAQGRWSESGERSADGQTWQPFFAMTLDRVK
jgi:hypothetical protein